MNVLNLLEVLVNEFLSLVEYLEKTGYKSKNDRIIIEKEDFCRLLEKNKYLTFKKKVQYYKAFNFIFFSFDSYTFPVKINKKTVRKVVINYKTYILLKYLYDYKFNI